MFITAIALAGNIITWCRPIVESVWAAVQVFFHNFLLHPDQFLPVLALLGVIVIGPVVGITFLAKKLVERQRKANET